MRQILLLRHAKSDWNDPGTPDHARPLNARGEQEAAALRHAMRSMGYRPQLVLVSSARRTTQTLETLAPWDEAPRVQSLDQLYLASPITLLQVLNGVADSISRVLVIGHNPGLHEFAMLLAEHDDSAPRQRLAEGLPTAGLVEFALECDWAMLDAGGAACRQFFTPRNPPARS